MPKGLPVDLFVNPKYPRGSSNGGVTTYYSDFIIAADPERGIPALFEREDHEVLIVEEFKGQLRAVPLRDKQAGNWVMFGGNFVFSSDSRFPSPSPIKVFDRVEGTRKEVPMPAAVVPDEPT